MKLRVLSLGAGVQSSTLALMIEHGDIPMVDCAIFADTMAEPKEVMDHLSWLKGKLSYPLHIVSKGNLTEDTIDIVEGRSHRKFMDIPFYTVNKETGKKGLLKRQCTSDYKITPVHQKIRQLLGLQKGEKRKRGTEVELLMGISIDEIVRMKENNVPWVKNVFPLIDNNISRQDCKNWFNERYQRQLPRSACIYCPYKTNGEWQYMKNEMPQEWDRAVEFDRKIRYGTTTEDSVFVHRSCKPLEEVTFKEEDTQYSLLDECDGMCGV